jgi:hypothetical protein
MPRNRRKNVVIIPLKLWLVPGRDDDLITFFQTLPSGTRAAAVMQAMRGGLTHPQPTPQADQEAEDILAALGETWS